MILKIMIINMLKNLQEKIDKDKENFRGDVETIKK